MAVRSIEDRITEKREQLRDLQDRKRLRDMQERVRMRVSTRKGKKRKRITHRTAHVR